MEEDGPLERKKRTVVVDTCVPSRNLFHEVLDLKNALISFVFLDNYVSFSLPRHRPQTWKTAVEVFTKIGRTRVTVDFISLIAKPNSIYISQLLACLL